MVTGLFPDRHMTDTYNLCDGDALEPIYKPERSTRGLVVYVCGNCGLLQSLPRTDRVARASAAEMCPVASTVRCVHRMPK